MAIERIVEIKEKTSVFHAHCSYIVILVEFCREQLNGFCRVGTTDHYALPHSPHFGRQGIGLGKYDIVFAFAESDSIIRVLLRYRYNSDFEFRLPFAGSEYIIFLPIHRTESSASSVIRSFRIHAKSIPDSRTENIININVMHAYRYAQHRT